VLVPIHCFKKELSLFVFQLTFLDCLAGHGLGSDLSGIVISVSAFSCFNLFYHAVNLLHGKFPRIFVLQPHLCLNISCNVKEVLMSRSNTQDNNTY